MTAALMMLGMGGSPKESAASATLGQRDNVLEACGFVDVLHEDLSVHSDWRDGLALTGIPEKRFRKVFTLRFPKTTENVLRVIEEHYDGWLAGGGVPFRWVRPKTSTEYYVIYRGAPQIRPKSGTGGDATVVLEEALLRD